MKAKPLILTAVLLASTAAFAGPGRGGPGPDLDKLAVLLDLDDYQAQEVENILTEQRESMRAEFEAARESGERPDRDAMRARHEAMRAETLDKLSAVLSPEQLEKFEVLAENRGKRGGPGRGMHGPGAEGVDAEDSE